MAATELTLVLSGHLRRPQSADMRPFWSGFIELQKRLPKGKLVRQIVTHSWNPDLAPLARAVYKPQADLHELQPCFYPDFMLQIEPPDRFERGVDRLTSTWKNVSIQSVLGNARSRARAVELLNKLPSHEGQVLITRWDLGQTGSKQVNHLVADASLPEDYIYLSYFTEVDEGYADMWLLAPWEDASQFSRFDAFVLDSITARNRYLELFTGARWPRARSKTRFETLWSHSIGQRVHALASKLVQCVQNHSTAASLPSRIVCRLTGPIKRFLLQPPLTAENSCLSGLEVRPPVYPEFQALNIHALLKFFILSEGLRDRVRFLTREDFDTTDQSGQLINPQPVALLIHEADDASILRLVAESPLPLASVYQICSGNVHQHVQDSQGHWGLTTLHATSSSKRDLMICALDAELSRAEEAVPLLVMPTVDRYLGCADWFYLNALAKYLAWSSTDYIGFANLRMGKPYLDFPDLHLVRGGGALSLHMAAGTAEGMRDFLNVADPELEEVTVRADLMRLEFPVVMKDGGLF